MPGKDAMIKQGRRVRKMEQAREEMNLAISRYYDAVHAAFPVGVLVWVQFGHDWHGPYSVVRHAGQDNVVLWNPYTKKERRVGAYRLRLAGG